MCCCLAKSTIYILVCMVKLLRKESPVSVVCLQDGRVCALWFLGNLTICKERKKEAGKRTSISLLLHNTTCNYKWIFFFNLMHFSVFVFFF